MGLRHMLVVCGITGLQNPSGNPPTQLFIDSQVFTVVDNFYLLHIKYVPHMIKDHNLVPNQEARFGAIQQCTLKALVWWAKDFSRS